MRITGGSLSLNGGNLSGALGVVDGSLTQPGVYFASDTNNGLHRSATDTVAVVAGGVATLSVSATVLTSLADKTVFGAGFIEFSERTAPAGPAANNARIWVQDNGASKSQLMVQFASGVAIPIALEV